MSAPTITVKDVWRGVLPPGTDLLGGGGGLERRVEWACALRTRPPAFEAVKGGEIAFVPVKSIRLLDERLDLPQVMTSFAEKGGVAVAVVGDVSVESIAAADRLMMPLLRLPDGIHAGDAHHTCVRFILDQRALLHERAQELQLSLMDLALGGAGPNKIIEKLAEVTGLPAAWQDESGEVRHLTASDLLLRDELAAEAGALRRWGLTIAALGADPPVHEFTLGRSGLAALVSPVPMRIGIGGFVSVIGDDQHLDQIARLAVARAASACAIDFDRERAVTETRDRLEGEFIASLLTGSYSSERVAQERARRLGADLSGRVMVIALRGTIPSSLWEAHALRAVQNVVARREVRALVAAHEDAVCVVAMPETEMAADVLYRLAETVRAECASVTGDTSTSLGLGRTHDGPAGVRQSYREAEHALEMGRRLLGPGRQASFTDLGLHRLLFAMAQHPELSDYYRGTVGDLLAYDERSSAELMTTLDAFFAANGSPTETAQRLHLHRNTVLYRLRRIEEVGHLRLDDPATRLNLHLCLRIRDVLQAGAARGAQPEPEAGPDG
jgi:PucR family transcriptional regulator, purine catabolism regulatory protein